MNFTHLPTKDGLGAGGGLEVGEKGGWGQQEEELQVTFAPGLGMRTPVTHIMTGVYRISLKLESVKRNNRALGGFKIVTF